MAAVHKIQTKTASISRLPVAYPSTNERLMTSLIPISNPVFRNDYTVPKKNVDLKIELDIFEPPFAPLILAEVEFSDEEMALAFIPPPWLCKDVTDNPEYHNSNMSRRVFRGIPP